jgi:hypothetical protein
VVSFASRTQRKRVVFHVMYGHPTELTDDVELTEWRTLCATYIYEGGPIPPLTLKQFRQWKEAQA